jgi:hypothetical protein
MSRDAFEAFIAWAPYELSISRYPNDPAKYAFPDQYRNDKVQIAWEVCQAAAAHEREAIAKHFDAMPHREFWTPEIVATIRTRGEK